jgi:hypothetical protein
MKSDFDANLANLFEKTRKPLDDDQFVYRVSRLIARSRRRRSSMTSGFWLMPVIMLIIATPSIYTGSIFLAKLLDNARPAVDSLMRSPVGWATLMIMWLLIYSRIRRLT